MKNSTKTNAAAAKVAKKTTKAAPVAATKTAVKPVATKKAAPKAADKAVEPAPAAEQKPEKRKGPMTADEKSARRITPGTPLNEWRMVKSQRVGVPGYFVQGGETKPGPKGPKSFFVGAETLYASLDAAKEALATKRTA
jgi:hypothetical protein